MVLVSLDGTTLTKEDPKLLGEVVNKWTMDALAKKEFHNVPEVIDTMPTKLGLEVRVRDSKSAHLVRMCPAKVNLRALPAEELGVLEMPLRRYSGFMRGDANASLTKEAMQLMVDSQMYLWRGISEGGYWLTVSSGPRRSASCCCVWPRRRRTAWPGSTAPSAWAFRVA